MLKSFWEDKRELLNTFVFLGVVLFVILFGMIVFYIAIHSSVKVNYEESRKKMMYELGYQQGMIDCMVEKERKVEKNDSRR